MDKISNIPESALPSELEKENAIRVNYKTNLLAPSLGPVSLGNQFTTITWLLLPILNTFNEVAEITKLILNTEVTSLPKKDDPEWRSNNRGMQVNTSFSEQFTAPLINFASRLREQTKIETTALVTTPVLRSSQTARGINSNLAQMEIAGKRAEGLSVVNDVADFLQVFALPNFVKRDLFRAGILKNNGSIIDSSFLKLNHEEHIGTLIEALSRSATKSAATAATTYYTKSALAKFSSANSKYREMASAISLDSGLQVKMSDYIQSQFSTSNLEPFDPDLDTEREWGITRYEELRLGLGTPFFRGPISAHSVSPKSKLTLSQASSLENELASIAVDSRTSSTIMTDSAISSSQFQTHLENLSEFGITNANAFSSTSTLFESLNEVRRSTIQQVANTISETNERRVLSRSSRRIVQSSEYVTEGKDEKLATTELEFQVVVPAKAQVRLLDVGLIWTPHVHEPFTPLRQLILDYKEQVENEYINQYQIPDPVKPEPTLEKDRVIHKTQVAVEAGKLNADGRIKGSFEFDLHSFMYGDVGIGSTKTVDVDKIDWKIEGNVISAEWVDIGVYPMDGVVQNLSFSGDVLRGDYIVSWKVPPRKAIAGGATLSLDIPIFSWDAKSVAAYRQYEASIKESKDQKVSISARAKQFAQLKAQELIQKYEGQYDLTKESFRQALKAIYGTNNSSIPEDRKTYFEQLLASCIIWSESSTVFSSAQLETLFYKDLLPDHFLNSPSVRLFLPIKRSAEKSFFEILKQMNQEMQKFEGESPDFYATAQKICDSVENYRSEIEKRKKLDSSQLVLDSFDTEIMIGHHLEAVLSRFNFSKSE